MSENVFRNKEEELQRLTQEIAELKSAIKDMASSLTRIERHVKRSFGIPPKNQSSERTLPRQKSTVSKKEEPTITAEDALRLFDELSESWGKQDPTIIDSKLQEMTVPNLKLIAHELGLTFKGKPSKKILCSGIMGRLNERSMLSKNINITSPMTEIKKD
jgi:hypothetical protein